MKLQNTKYDLLIKNILLYLSTSLTGPWSRRSLGIISLLLGFYLGSNITIYYLEKAGQRPMVVLIILIIFEILVRIRTNIKVAPFPIFWLGLDNIRVGITYSLVLEAFKLGS